MTDTELGRIVRQLPDEKLRKFLNGCIEQGRSNSDGYYNESPLLEWFIADWIKDKSK